MKGTNNLEEGTEDDQPEGEMQIGHLELNALNFLSHDEDSDAASEEAFQDWMKDDELDLWGNQLSS